MLTVLFVFVAGLSLLIGLLFLVIGTLWNQVKALNKRVETLDGAVKEVIHSRIRSEANLGKRLVEIKNLVDAAIQAARHRPGVH